MTIYECKHLCRIRRLGQHYLPLGETMIAWTEGELFHQMPGIHTLLIIVSALILSHIHNTVAPRPLVSFLLSEFTIGYLQRIYHILIAPHSLPVSHKSAESAKTSKWPSIFVFDERIYHILIPVPSLPVSHKSAGSARTSKWPSIFVFDERIYHILIPVPSLPVSHKSAGSAKTSR